MVQIIHLNLETRLISSDKADLFRHEAHIVKVSNTRLSKIVVAGLMILLLGSPARSESFCDTLRRYAGAAGIEFKRNRGPLIGQNRWKAQNGFTGGNCEINLVDKPTMNGIFCLFNPRAVETEIQSYYLTMAGNVQECLKQLESRNDWRKRDTSRTDEGGRTIKETTWIWTELRDQVDNRITVSGNTGGSMPSNNFLVVTWSLRSDD